MRIAFLTLFLGLVSGRVPVELAVTGQGPAIAAIDLVLDGKPAGHLAGPPWKGEVDLGRDLLPHHLEARALDASGAPASGAEQWLNLPQRLAEVDAVPEPGPEGRIAAVRLAFQSVTHEEPTAVTATLDGNPEVENVSTLNKMRYAYGRLTRDLAAQRIVWVDGRHLPESISLSPQAAQAVKGLELVAGPQR